MLPVYEIRELDRIPDDYDPPPLRMFDVYAETDTSSASMHLLWDPPSGQWWIRQTDKGFETEWGHL